MADVDVDRSRLAVVRPAPDRLEQLLPREHAPGTACQRTQELELDVGDLDRRSVALDRAARRIDPQSRDLDRVLLRRSVPGRRRATQERFHPAAELADRE